MNRAYDVVEAEPLERPAVELLSLLPRYASETNLGTLRLCLPVLICSAQITHQNPAFGTTQVRELTEIFVRKSNEVRCYPEDARSLRLHSSSHHTAASRLLVACHARRSCHHRRDRRFEQDDLGCDWLSGCVSTLILDCLCLISLITISRVRLQLRWPQPRGEAKRAQPRIPPALLELIGANLCFGIPGQLDPVSDAHRMSPLHPFYAYTPPC